MAGERVHTRDEVAQHCSPGDAWIIVHGDVLDVSVFAAVHPGGKHILQQYAGKDATEAFLLSHNSAVLPKYRARLLAGRLADYHPPGMKTRAMAEAAGMFGELVPFGDPMWYTRFKSPWYKPTHVDFRAKVRAFTEEHIVPNMRDWKFLSQPPRELTEEMGRLGFLAIMCGPPFPRTYVDAAICTHEPHEYDHFHELILYDELSRCGHSALLAAITNGPAIAMPALLRFGSEDMKQRVAPDVLAGRKFVALAISEPGAGSDVAGLRCAARPTAYGQFYEVVGNKKWITNGTYADYFVTAVVTGKPGHEGLSLLLIEKTAPGFSIRKVNIRDSDISGTAYLDFDHTPVPRQNLIGKENAGFKLIMYNFNHERMYIVAMCARLARICLEESIKYAAGRKTFGKALSEHQAIRMKIADMARHVEMLQAWLEILTYQLCHMTHAEANAQLGDIFCLLKAQCSKVYDLCARETTHIFGGNALHVGGVGDKIEGATLQVKGYQIPAGAEDIMDDFAARTAFKLLAKSRL